MGNIFYSNQMKLVSLTILLGHLLKILSYIFLFPALTLQWLLTEGVIYKNKCSLKLLWLFTNIKKPMPEYLPIFFLFIYLKNSFPSAIKFVLRRVRSNFTLVLLLNTGLSSQPIPPPSPPSLGVSSFPLPSLQGVIPSTPSLFTWSQSFPPFPLHKESALPPFPSSQGVSPSPPSFFTRSQSFLLFPLH